MNITEAQCSVDRVDIFDRVKLVRQQDLGWPFDADDGPRFSVQPRDSRAFGHTEKVDPFPCYAHSVDRVITTAKLVEAAFPVCVPPNYWLPAFEAQSRTNGYTSTHYIHNETETPEREPFIVLSGKRIPIHPAMTRYLVAHEYGHVVKYWIDQCQNNKDGWQTAFDRQYAKMRKVALDSRYGALHWHTNIGEIIANDFRILVCGVEREFWPHDCDHPETTPGLQNYWNELVERFRCKHTKRKENDS